MKRGRYPSAARAKTEALETRILILIWRRPYSHAHNRAPEGRAGHSQDLYRARSTGKGSYTSADVEGLTAAGCCSRTRWVRFAGCLLLPRDTVYQILVQ
jgi:hypothetical protein